MTAAGPAGVLVGTFVGAGIAAWCAPRPRSLPRVLGASSLPEAAAAPAGEGQRLGSDHFRGRGTTPGAGIAAMGSLSLALLLLLLGFVRSGLVIAVAGVLAWLHRRRTRREQLEATQDGIVELVRGLAAELRAGSTPAAAFVATAAVAVPSLREWLEPATSVANRGDAGGVGDVLLVIGIGRRSGWAGMAVLRLAACWRVATSSGAALAASIERLADALQDDLDLRQELAAALAGPRTTVRLLATLPAFGLLLGSAIGARPLSFLAGSVAGRTCVVAATALEIGGLVWARHIARVALPR